VQHGAQIDLRNAEGQTPLLRNIKTGSLELLEFYVNAGADVNAKDALGYTPLMLLGDRPRLEVAELLLTGGAYVNLIPVKSCTALDWLLSYRNCSAAVEREAVISYLRAHGAKTAGELK
jgi:ankyrin repeat protein